METKKRKCGYARVSTLAEEQEHSLVAQTEYYRDLIQNDPNAEFVGIYADKRSGKNTRQRPQFMAMLKAARRGEIDYIITKSIARFARNLVETLNIVHELRAMNVGVYFEKENIDTLDSSADFILSIYSTVAEGELISMSENVKWAARKRYAKGSVELNSLIYGYTLKDGELIPVPEEAAIVREIFERYANGEGHNRIARALNARGVKKKASDGLWRSTDIGRILANEKHIGDALLQKTFKENFRPVKNKGEIPQTYVENNHEANIGRAVFESVQERLWEVGKQAAKRIPYPLSPFSSKIKCAECGKGYLRRKNNRNTPYEKWIWSCQTYFQHGRSYCGGHNIREQDLQALFLSAYNEAAGYENPDAPTVNLSESIKALLSQERELIALKVKGYISRPAYEEQHGELVKMIKETEAALLLEARKVSKKCEPAEEYSDALAATLEAAAIDGFTITFTFKNGAVIRRLFNNNADRKETWSRKLRRTL